MRYFIFLFLLVVGSGCGSSKVSRVGSLDAEPCQTTDAARVGLICSTASNTWQPILPGQCKSSPDCALPYNACVGNVCVVDNSGSKIWFATDPIQPGVTQKCNSPACSDQSDYIYNIMAKGLDSLDDWCMSQAQKSSVAKVRNIQAWRALVLAQPDSAKISTHASRMIQLFNNLNSYGFPEKGSFGSNNSIFDKEGNLLSNFSAWTGLARPYCQAFISMNGVCPNSSLTSPGTCPATQCSSFRPSSECSSSLVCAPSFICLNPAQGCPPTCNNLVGCPSSGVISVPSASSVSFLVQAPKNNNLWSGVNGNSGLFIQTPGQSCGSLFDFASDCEGGTYYGASNGTAHPILCLEKDGPSDGSVYCKKQPTNLLTDPANCGLCGINCGVGASCQQGVCQCGTGQAFCNGKCIQTLSDPNNCGACGFSCFPGTSCQNGVCYSPSNAGWQNTNPGSGSTGNGNQCLTEENCGCRCRDGTYVAKCVLLGGCSSKCDSVCASHSGQSASCGVQGNDSYLSQGGCLNTSQSCNCSY